MKHNSASANTPPAGIVEAIRNEMTQLGLPADTDLFDWVPEALVESGVVADERCYRAKWWPLLWHLSKGWKPSALRDQAMVELALHLGWPESVRNMFGCGSDDFAPREARDQFFAMCKAHGVDFNRGLIRACAADRRNIPLVFVLADQGLVDWRRFLDLDVIVRTWLKDDSYPMCRPASSLSSFDMDIRSPRLWMMVSPEAIIDELGSALKSMDDETVARSLRSVMSGLVSNPRPGRDPVLWQQRQQRNMQRITRLACDRMGSNATRAAPAIRRTCLTCAQRLLERWGDPEPSDGPALRQAAQIELAGWRPLLQRANEPEAEREFEQVLDLLNGIAFVLFHTAPLWDAIRPLLLSFRSLGTPSVTPGLRYWSMRQWPTQQGNPDLPDPPQPWYLIPEAIAIHFHERVGSEEERDEELSDLRTRFASFCLERLQSKTKGGSPIEPNPAWRLGYIAAAIELRINPKGQGHRTLYHASQHDPDEQVRRMAHGAYIKMRRGMKLGAMSPRTAFFHAFWQVRRAHMLGLGQTVHQGAAEATREQEVRRTTKPISEDRLPSPSDIPSSSGDRNPTP